MQLTVIIPFRNSELTIAKTLASIQHSLISIPKQEIEILFIDNGSSDSSRETVEDFCTTTSIAKCIEEPFQGVSSARNAGLTAAQGDYIASIDSDDEIAPNYFRDVLEVLVRGPDLVIMPLKSANSKVVETFNVESDLLGALNVLSGWWGVQFFFRRALCENFMFQGECYEDYGFFPQLMQRCRSIIVLHGSLYKYNDNPSSITKMSASWRLSQLEKMARTLLSDHILENDFLIERLKTDIFATSIQLRAEMGIWPLSSWSDFTFTMFHSRAHRARLIYAVLRCSLSCISKRMKLFSSRS
ncbi:MAG: glycosyltransferase family 2 protein [Pseudomonadota bacterium]